MKKLLATLLASSMALTAIGGLVACGGDDKPGGGYDDPFNKTITGTWAAPEETYWVAATLKYYDNATWGDDAGTATIPEDFQFQQNSDNKDLYKVTLNLYKGDIFKIRYADTSWDDMPGISKLTADENLLKSLNTATSPISEEAGEGLGGKNFVVNQDGVYELRINTAPTDKSIVTYVRKSDAPVLSTSYCVDFYGKFGDATGWANSTVRSTEVTDPTEDTTHEISMEFAEGDEFGLRVMQKVTKGEVAGDWKQGSWIGATSTAIEEDHEAFEASAGGNFSCVTAGTYKFTVVLAADGSVKTVKIATVTA